MNKRSIWNALRNKQVTVTAVCAAVLAFGSTSASAQLDPGNIAYGNLGALNIAGGDNVTIDTSTGTITINANPPITGATQVQGGGAGNIAVFDFSSITIAAGANITVTGTNALALLSKGNASV